MQNINNDPVDISSIMKIPSGLIKAEVDGLYGSTVLQDMYDIIKLYDIYEKGASFTASAKDYVPANLRYKTIHALIDKEARFLCSKPMEFFIDTDMADQAGRDAATTYQDLIDKVLKKNHFTGSLVKAAKDCFIGKRVALMFNINEDRGIKISFLPSLEFVYEVDPNDSDILTKIVAFYGINSAKNRKEQRIYKKKYWMENGLCHYSEEIYDGQGELVETIQAPSATKFSFIPAWVIVNDGLSGDLLGESEVDFLSDFESWYSKLGSRDIDAEQMGMNAIKYSIDADHESTKNLSIAPGAFWDLASDQNQAQDRAAQVGTLENNMSYSPALSATLDRIKNTMYEQSAVPNVSPEAMKGVVTSGKTLKAIYWDLIVRCDEKMLTWGPALEFLGKCIIEGARLYPKVLPMYIDDPLPSENYVIRVNNQYPLPEDEQEEKNVDLAEVDSQTMSKKSYMMKWRNLTNEEADAELLQIAKERELLEDSYMNPQQPEENTEEEEELINE